MPYESERPTNLRVYVSKVDREVIQNIEALVREAYLAKHGARSATHLDAFFAKFRERPNGKAKP